MPPRARLWFAIHVNSSGDCKASDLPLFVVSRGDSLGSRGCAVGLLPLFTDVDPIRFGMALFVDRYCQLRCMMNGGCGWWDVDGWYFEGKSQEGKEAGRVLFYS